LGKYVRDKKLLNLEEAIYKMTLFPAKTYGIENRGQLKKGLKADLVIFDPNTIIDKATFIQPHQYPVGISHVLVKGKWSIKNGVFLNKMNGVILRKTIQKTTSAGGNELLGSLNEIFLSIKDKRLNLLNL
jgi:N-acyl-D-aspartate/D-glutamate deacylase